MVVNKNDDPLADVKQEMIEGDSVKFVLLD